MTATCTRAQCFERAKLKLLDSALRPSKFQSNVSNTFLLDETFHNDGTLIFRQAVYELKKSGPAFNSPPMGVIEIVVGYRIRPLLRYFFSSV